MYVEFIYAIAWTALIFWMGRYHGLEVAECRRKNREMAAFEAQRLGQLRMMHGEPPINSKLLKMVYEQSKANAGATSDPQQSPSTSGPQ